MQANDAKRQAARAYESVATEIPSSEEKITANGYNNLLVVARIVLIGMTTPKKLHMRLLRQLPAVQCMIVFL